MSSEITRFEGNVTYFCGDIFMKKVFKNCPFTLTELRDRTMTIYCKSECHISPYFVMELFSYLLMQTSAILGILFFKQDESKTVWTDHFQYEVKISLHIYFPFSYYRFLKIRSPFCRTLLHKYCRANHPALKTI